MRDNEAGITLVELLATLVLVTIVTAVIWNTVFISMKYTTIETKKLRLQQEANYIITEIQRYHRQCDSYDLTINREEIEIDDCKRLSTGPIKEVTFPLPYLKISNDFIYGAVPSIEEDDDESEVVMFDRMGIDTKNSHSSLLFTLIVQDAEREKLKVEIPTNISRYKEN